MKRLIVNADDLGLHHLVNVGIIEGYEKGCVTSASLIASGEAAEEAAQLAKGSPGLGVGVHLTFVAERPVLSPEKVPSLMDESGRFPPDHIAFIRRYIGGKIRMEELLAESEAQISRVISFGIRPTHIDSHQHLHALPRVSRMTAELAKKYGIEKIRVPGEDVFFSGGYHAPLFRWLSRCGLTACARLSERVFQRYGLSSPDNFFGMLAGGNMLEEELLAILQELPDGTSEIMVHPGKDSGALDEIFRWGYHWDGELAAVTSGKVLELISQRSVRPISFGEL